MDFSCLDVLILVLGTILLLCGKKFHSYAQEKKKIVSMSIAIILASACTACSSDLESIFGSKRDSMVFTLQYLVHVW